MILFLKFISKLYINDSKKFAMVQEYRVDSLLSCYHQERIPREKSWEKVRKNGANKYRFFLETKLTRDRVAR